MTIGTVSKYLAKPTYLRKFVTNLNKPGVLMPVILLEATVDVGRTYQAYKRGGKTEARERITEESLAGAFWLGGVTWLNKIGNKVGEKLFNVKTMEFDLDKDLARNPLALFLKKENMDAAKKKLVLFKFGKIVASIAGAWIIVGTLIPKFNQAVTRKVLSRRHKKACPTKKEENTTQKQTTVASPLPKEQTLQFEQIKQLIKNNQGTLSFKGGPFTIEGIATFANNLENHAIYKLGATDMGVLTSRTYNARNNDERLEIAIRDVSSLYFYYLCTTHVRELLNKFDGYGGKLSTLNPMAAMQIHNKLTSLLNMRSDGKISLEMAKKYALGFNIEQIDALIKKVPFKDGVIPLEDFIKYANENNLFDKKGGKINKARMMAELQPEFNLSTPNSVNKFSKILTREQVYNILNDSLLSSPKLTKQVMIETFGEDFSKPYKYIANKKVEETRKHMDDYVKAIIEYAEKNSLTEINSQALETINKKNLFRYGLHTVAGIGVSALFLSTLIPKFQYWVTKKRTGKDGFPGVEGLAKKTCPKDSK